MHIAKHLLPGVKHRPILGSRRSHLGLAERLDRQNHPSAINGEDLIPPPVIHLTSAVAHCCVAAEAHDLPGGLVREDS